MFFLIIALCERNNEKEYNPKYHVSSSLIAQDERAGAFILGEYGIMAGLGTQ